MPDQPQDPPSQSGSEQTHWFSHLNEESGPDTDAIPPRAPDAPTLLPSTDSPVDAEAPTMAPAGAPTMAPAEVALPGYQILGELGRGGMGVVYKARHLQLNRLVAVKMILSGAHAGSDDLVRFLSEAEAVATLQHPNIVQVYEVSHFQKLPYMALEFVEGGTLAQKLRTGPLEGKEAARIVEQMAQGMNAAHQAGVVHRDLKPDNVLMTAQGTPKITDFGLAKKVEGGGELTRTGAILGTPSYMAPEQAGGEGKRVGPAADVYALGAILYACLTGQPPFKAADPLETVLQVVNKEPKAPTLLNPKVPKDLETICLKCLQKDPVKRYPNAQALADDLKRWQNNWPIKARPVGRTERAIKWVRRNPVVSGLLAAVLLVLTGGLVGIAWAYGKAVRNEHRMLVEKQRVEEEKRRADLKAIEAVRAKEKATNEKERADQEAKKALSAKEIADAEKKRAEEELARAERQIYVGNLREAQLALDIGDYGTAAQRLTACREDFRGWAHRHLFTRCHKGQVTLHGHTVYVKDVAFSPNGQYIASVGLLGRVILWDAKTGQKIHTLEGHNGNLFAVAFSPNGRYIASGGQDRVIKLWDVKTAKEVHTFRGHRHSVNSLAFSPNGKRIASGSQDRRAYVWDVPSRRLLKILQGHTHGINSVAYSPNGNQVLSASTDKTLKIWDADTGRELKTLKGHTGSVKGAAYSPNGKRVVSGGVDRTLRIWDLENDEKPLVLSGHTDAVTDVAFSPDGLQIVSSSHDRSLKLWDSTTGKETLTLHGHLLYVECVAFGPEGRRIVSGSLDYTVKVWNIEAYQKAIQVRQQKNVVAGVAFSPDGRHMASGNYDRIIRVWDAETAKELYALEGHASGVAAVAYSPNGKHMASGSWDRTVKLWDTKTRKEVFTFRGHKDPINGIAFSPDGKHIVSGSGLMHGYTRAAVPGEIKVWDAITRKPVQTILGHTGGVSSVAYSPDGRHIVSGGGVPYKLGEVKVWDAISGKELLNLKGHTDIVNGIAYSPDGRHIVSASCDRTLKIWDAATGKELRTLKGHPNFVWCVAYSPDGRHIISGGEANNVRIWNAQTGEEVLTLRGHKFAVRSVAFSPNGNQIASGSWEGTFRLWDASIGAKSLDQHIKDSLSQWSRPDPQWHKEQAERAKSAKQWHAMAFHLQRAAKDRSHSIALYEEALKTDPGDREAATALAMLLAEVQPEPWTVLKPSSVESQWGTKFTILPDHSVLASGPLPDNDSYVVTAPLKGETLAAIRIEMLAQPGLPGGGPGRAHSGNVCLTEIRARHLTPKGESKQLLLSAAVADYSHPPDDMTTRLDGAPGVIDGRQATRWDFHPRTGQDHWIAAQIGGHWKAQKGDSLVVEMDFHSQWKQHLPGRFRLSVSDHPDAILIAALRSSIRKGRLNGFPALAAAYFAKGEWERARQILTAPGVGMATKSTTECLLLALAEDRLHQPEKARKAYDRALKKLEKNQPDELARALAQQAMTRVGGHQPSRAKALLARLDRSREAAVPNGITILPTPNIREHKATPEQIIQWIKALDAASFTAREKAAESLEQAGEPALTLLTEAIQKKEIARAEQAREILDRIRLQKGLQGQKLNLTLTGAQPVDALKALSQKSGIDIQYDPLTSTSVKPGPISLKLENVSFWKALDQICQQATMAHGVPIGPVAPRIRTYPVSDAALSPVDYQGAFRLEAKSIHLSKLASLNRATPADKPFWTLNLTLAHNAALPLNMALPRIVEAIDANGKPVALGNPGSASYSKAIPLYPKALAVTLPSALPQGSRLKRLKLAVPLEVGLPQGEPLKIAGIVEARGKTFSHDNCALQLNTISYRKGSPTVGITLTLHTLDKDFSPQKEMLDFQLLDQNGKPYPLSGTPYFSRRSIPGPHPSVLGIAGLTTAPVPGHVPWATLQMHQRESNYYQWTTSLRFYASDTASQPQTLIFAPLKKIQTEIRFELKEIPLP